MADTECGIHWCNSFVSLPENEKEFSEVAGSNLCLQYAL